MKQIIFITLFCLFSGLLYAQKAGDLLYVNVKSVNLKSSAGALAPDVPDGTVEYTNEVKVLSVKGNWVQVQTTAGNKTGWIPYASVTSKRMAPAGTPASASAREMSLAGKGFSPEVEKEYKKEKRELNYDDIDAMEEINVSDDNLRIFLEEGRLAGGEAR